MQGASVMSGEEAPVRRMIRADGRRHLRRRARCVISGERDLGLATYFWSSQRNELSEVGVVREVVASRISPEVPVISASGSVGWGSIAFARSKIRFSLAEISETKAIFRDRRRVRSAGRKTMALKLRADCGQTRGQYPAPPP